MTVEHPEIADGNVPGATNTGSRSGTIPDPSTAATGANPAGADEGLVEEVARLLCERAYCEPWQDADDETREYFLSAASGLSNYGLRLMVGYLADHRGES